MSDSVQDLDLGYRLADGANSQGHGLWVGECSVLPQYPIARDRGELP